MISGVTTNTMSSIPTRPLKVSVMDQLKLQLTQMKNENELLRSQVIKAANQADVAEKRLEETLKAQSEQPSEIQVNGIIMLQNQLDNIKKQIDDEKEKVQNLQFTNEEQNVVNIELQNKNAELLIKIKELELDLTKERNLAKDIEKETMKIFEKEEELCRVKEELETLKKLIDNNEDELQKSVSNLSSEVVDKEAILNTLRQTLNENSQNHERLLKEANENLSATTERLTKIIEEKEKQIEQNQEMIDQLNEGIKCLSALKNEEHDDIVNSLKTELSKLKNEYQLIIDEKEQCMKITQENHIKIENELKQELKSLSENKNQEIQHLQQNNLEKFEKLEIVNQNINMELKAALKSIQDQTNDIANLEKKYSDLELQQDLNKNELEKELTTKLKTTENELTSLRSEKSILEVKHENYVKQTENATNVLENQLKQNNILIENLEKSLNELTLSKLNELDSMKKQILQLEEERDNLLKCQSLELATKDELINTLSNKLELTLTEKQKQDLSNANLQTELTNETLKYQTTIKDLQNKINELEANIASNCKSFKSELELLSNEKLASESENLNLLEKLKCLENLRLNLEEKLVSNEICIQDIQNLNDVIEEKNKIIDDNQIKIKELDNFVTQTKNEYGVILDQKEKEIKELLKIGKENMELEKLSLQEKTQVIIDEKNKENSILNKKIVDLENIKQDLEKQLETSKSHEQDLTQLNEIIQDKIKTIKDNDLNIEQLNNKIMLCKEEFNSELKGKEDQIKELIKIGEEKLVLENHATHTLDEKSKEISNLIEKLNILENSKSNLEKHLEISKTQEYDIIELKKDIQEKTKIIDDNNSKVEMLNSLIAQTKEDFSMRLKEKENEVHELVKTIEDKLNVEKLSFDTRIKSCVDEKNTEIKLLKTQLHEFAENNKEKELMLKLESTINELEKEKLRASNLEALKLELEKTILQHKTELELLNVSKMNMKEEMIKTIEKQQVLNTELTTKTKTESERLDGEKLNIQKQIDELQIECSRLRSTLDDKNREIENLKIQISQELKPAVSCNDELSQLKALLEKSHSAQSHLEFRIQELTDENHRLNERIEGDNNQLHKNDNIMQEKYNIEKKYEETYNILKIKENQILVLQTELNSWKLKDTEKSRNNMAQENINKSEAHLLAEKNQEIKMLNSIILGLHKKLSAVMETDVSEYEIEKNPDSISKEDYQKLYKTAKNNVKLKECENLSLKQEINKLKTENDRYSEFKTKCESLENDKKSLQKLIVSYDNSIPSNVKSDTKSETEKILEEKDWQINLLNNIIADLHAKVSDNKFKIEALETQILDSGVEQNSKKTRLRTTRLYCERCEIFDSHDTEDCPEKPESPKFQRKRRVVNDSSNKMIDEPFCVCCDMFGHTANECDNSLTF
uniref:CAP-Gly domain-containing linker protein 1 n=1 Tax=Schizaphis graminum TaxID=13262 RepID=A0A2S2PM99_SCHGA